MKADLNFNIRYSKFSIQKLKNSTMKYNSNISPLLPQTKHAHKMPTPANRNSIFDIRYSIFFLLLAAALTTCKKAPDAPTGTNKIEIGQTAADSVGYFAAKVSTTITSTGGNQITQHGHCWSTKSKPTTEDDKTSLGKLEGPKTYNSELTGLAANTTYYIRPYVTYAYGTVYGEEKNIKTLETGKPTVQTTEVTDVTLYSAKCGGNVLADSGLFVTARGFCWDTTNSFTITDCLDTTIVGSGTGSIISTITGLNEGVNYFVKAYAINEKGISYGEAKQFSTIPITTPLVNTTEVTAISTTSAQSGGNVTSDGNGTVTERGVCWNITGNPSLQNNTGYTTDGSGTGIYTSQLNGLTDNTTYYVAAFATNEKGISYGEVKQFSTIPITTPLVNTTEVTAISTTSAQSGGNVTSDGNGTVTERGVCWNTTGNPSLQNNTGYTTDGSGTGIYTSQLNGLTDNTTYYVAAYATNEKGTAYGQTKSFLTKNYLVDPRDGQTYETVEIGTQTWMAENLNYQSANSWWYDNSSANGDVYGRLYTWDAATIACPEGWHLPSDAEWTVLTDYLGGEDVAGGKMKEEGYEHWNEPNTGATNRSGFTALPGGYRYSDGSFYGLGGNGYWWSSTETSGAGAWIRYLSFNDAQVGRYDSNKTSGFSVRCLKD